MACPRLLQRVAREVPHGVGAPQRGAHLVAEGLQEVAAATEGGSAPRGQTCFTLRWGRARMAWRMAKCVAQHHTVYGTADPAYLNLWSLCPSPPALHTGTHSPPP